jgi:DnaJ-class molecular chaperone
MGGVVRRELISEKCEKCGGTGAPFLIPGDPTSGHDLNKTCDRCNGAGYIHSVKQS